MTPEVDGRGPAAVTSVGSVNIDRVRTVTSGELAELTARFDWLPGPGETVPIGTPPADFAGPFETYLGGKGANQAVAAARAGASTVLFGAVGADHGEVDVLTALRDRGVRVDGLAVRDGPTGTAHILVEPSGENRIAIVEGANGTVDRAYVADVLEPVRAAAVLLLQNEIPVPAADALLSRLDGDPERPTVVLDPAPTAGVAPLLRHPCVDVVTPNDAEYAALGTRLRRFRGVVIRTRGASGAVIERDGGTRPVPAPPVKPVDATAAGDVLNGYLAAGLASGRPIETATTRAVVAASLSTERRGAQPSVPDPGAVDRAFEADR